MTCVHPLLHLGNSSALKAFFFFFSPTSGFINRE